MTDLNENNQQSFALMQENAQQNNEVAKKMGTVMHNLDVPFNLNKEVKACGAIFDGVNRTWKISNENLVKNKETLEPYTKPRVVMDTKFMPQNELREAHGWGIMRQPMQIEKQTDKGVQVVTENVFTAPAVIAEKHPEILEKFSQKAVNERQNAQKAEQGQMVDLEIPTYFQLNPNFQEKYKAFDENGMRNPKDYDHNINGRYNFDDNKKLEAQKELKANGAFFDGARGTWTVDQAKFAEKKEVLGKYEKSKGETVELFPQNDKQKDILATNGIYKIDPKNQYDHTYRIANCVDKKVAAQAKKEMGKGSFEKGLKANDKERIEAVKDRTDPIVISCQSGGGQATTNAKELAFNQLKSEHNALIVKQAMPNVYGVDDGQKVKNQENKVMDLLKAANTLRQNNPNAPIILQHEPSLNKAIQGNKKLEAHVNSECSRLAVQRVSADVRSVAKGVINDGFKIVADYTKVFENAKGLIQSKVATKEASQKVNVAIEKEKAQELSQKQELQEKLVQQKEQTKTKSRGR